MKLLFLGTTFQSPPTSAGTVNNGGKVYFYKAGTSTPKDTYTTSALTTENDNPLILDANGRGTAWLNGTYKIRVTDADDVLIDEEDNYNPTNAADANRFNLVLNGSFEDATTSTTTPDNWTVTTYTNGTAVLDDTDRSHGTKCMKFTSTGSGGGYMTSDDYFEVSPNIDVTVAFELKSSDAGVRNVVDILWYTSDKTAVSTTSIYDNSTTNPTSWTVKYATSTPPATAYYAKLRLYGCHSSDATTGTTRYDNVRAFPADIVSASLGLTAFIETLFDDADAATARTTLGAAGLTGDETIAGNKTLSGNNVHSGNNTHSGTEGFSNTVTMTGAAINEAKGSDIASATTTDIGAATGNFVDVTGTTTITGLGTVQAGTRRKVRFTGALILTHNATSLILPGAANITTVANDVAEFESLGSGNWVCTSYTRAAGTPLVAPTAAQGASLVLLDSATASTSAVLDVSIGSSYDKVIIDIINLVPATNATALYLQMSVDDGSNYDTGASYQYAVLGFGSDGTTRNGNSAGTTNIALGGFVDGISNTASNTGFSGTLELLGFNSASLRKSMTWKGKYIGAAVNHVTGCGDGAGATLTGAAVNNIRVFFSSGNITSGTIRAFGVKNS